MQIKGSDAAQQAERAWVRVHGDSSIQYAPVSVPPEPPRPPTPQWLKDVAEFLGNLFGGAWPVMKWVLLAALIGFVLLFVWRMIEPLLDRPRKQGAEVPEWRPDRAAALALLEDADALAAAGRYDEAAHLLLQRSVGQIAAAQPDWVRPASTARELAGLAALPEAARGAFGIIAGRVEASRYALRPLLQADWQAAREAYAQFALQRLPAVAG